MTGFRVVKREVRFEQTFSVLLRRYAIHERRDVISIMWNKKRTKVNREKIEKENKQRREFKNILLTAQDIINQTTTYKETHPIYLLIKKLVEFELHKNIYNSISSRDSNSVKDFNGSYILPRGYQANGHNSMFLSDDNEEDYFYVTGDGKPLTYDNFMDESKIQGKSVSILLGTDPVLTRPWNTKRLTGAVCNIGSGKPHGDWREDSNHCAELWLPFGVTFVTNGNHSITAGILGNEGELKVNNIYDVSKVCPHIYCDGVNYFRTRDDSFYAPVWNFSLAAIYEIGRLIVKNNVPVGLIKFKD
ncbi:DUF6710 family protein [Paenibacillus massiliensis]|uniref:DUF6710 family protein n=1 Tax=Paenibacillus massiliensis TaxID=225917 RepID=UPI0004B9BBF4|nr:DUF6710 family protein [Paenibacillus massiliensis]